MKLEESLVSVIIPLFNTEVLIDKAIQSIIRQTYSNWELLICDDGSTDSSLFIAEKWQEKDSRIKVLKNEVNCGHVYTYNRLFEASVGDFIMIQDADDWSHPMRMEKQVQILEQNKVGLCVTNSIFYSPKGVPSKFPKQTEGIIDIFTKEHWAPATMMFRRSILIAIPGLHRYFERLTSMDRYFIMEILDKYKGYYLEEELYFVQVRTNSDHRSIDLSNSLALRKMIITDVYWQLKKQRQNSGTDWIKEAQWDKIKAFEFELLNNKNYIAEKIRIFASIQIDFRKYKTALKLLVAAIRKAPLYFKNYRTLFYLVRARTFR